VWQEPSPSWVLLAYVLPVALVANLPALARYTGASA